MFRQEKKYYARAFLYALAMAAVLLAPFVLLDGGYFVYYGDYNAQQIPFYKTCIEAVQSGNLGWNWRTDLGANFVGSYSFYTDRKSTRLNSSHRSQSRMPSSA